MAKGWEQVEQAAQAQQEARERAQQSGKPQLYTSHVEKAPNQQVVGRFLEQGQDVNNFAVHEYRVPDPNASNGFRRRVFTCLNDKNDGTPCPGCQAGFKRKIRGVFNFLYRNRPQLRRGADGKAVKVGNDYIVDGFADEVVILDVPSTTAEFLRKKDASMHGLMSRDVALTLSGNSFQPWTIEPADIDSGPQPLSEADQILLAKKHDLDEFMKPPSFQEAAQIVAKYGANSGAQQQTVQSGPPHAANAGQAAAANGFLAGANAPVGGDSAFGASVPAPPGQPAVAPAAPAEPAGAPAQ